jgi:hypothetical protein
VGRFIAQPESAMTIVTPLRGRAQRSPQIQAACLQMRDHAERIERSVAFLDTLRDTIALFAQEYDPGFSTRLVVCDYLRTELVGIADALSELSGGLGRPSDSA